MSAAEIADCLVDRRSGRSSLQLIGLRRFAFPCFVPGTGFAKRFFGTNPRKPTMFRVTHARHDETGDTLKLEGKLVEPWVSEVRNLVQNGEMGRRPGLDLSGLTYVDASGVDLLDQLVEQGFQVVFSAPYITELLRLRRDRSGT
jgi:ABC-type transporter Mla MlaB component